MSRFDEEFPEAGPLAEANGLTLLRRNSAHYTLQQKTSRQPQWHLLVDGSHHSIVRLTLPLVAPWTLTDAVNAAIEILQISQE